VADLVVQSRRDGDLGLVDLAGDAGLERVDVFRTAAKSLLAEGAAALVVGVKGLRFADSASLGVFLELDKACAAAKKRFVVHGLSPRIEKTLAAMGLSARFETAANEAAARKLLARE
jgi:anti-anti-sigma factor